MRVRIYPCQWYKVQEAESLTGLSNRAIRRRCEDLARDGILARVEGQHLSLRGVIVQALRDGRPLERATVPDSISTVAADVRLELDTSNAQGDLDHWVRQAAARVLNGRKCFARLASGDAVEVTLILQ